MVFQVRVGPEDHKNIQGKLSGTARNLKHNQSMTKFALAGSQDVVDDNTNHRGARMVFHTMNSNNTWKEPQCL